MPHTQKTMLRFINQLNQSQLEKMYIPLGKTLGQKEEVFNFDDERRDTLALCREILRHLRTSKEIFQPDNWSLIGRWINVLRFFQFLEKQGETAEARNTIACYNFIKNKNDLALAILENKNTDYADGGLSNFTDLIGYGISAEDSIRVRLVDKFNRLKNLLENDRIFVKDETTADTIDDAINYFRLAQYLVILQLGGGIDVPK